MIEKKNLKKVKILISLEDIVEMAHAIIRATQWNDFSLQVMTCPKVGNGGTHTNRYTLSFSKQKIEK